MNTNETRKPKCLDIFSGIGGFSLAFESEGFETVGFVECDERKRIVLRHWWPGVRIFDDVRDVDGIRQFCEAIGGIDVLTGGVPCQPASALGQMRGTADERWLWPDAIRLVCAIRPRFAVFENPPSLLVLENGGAWNGIVSGLVAGGYDLWWDVFPAAAFGAGHLRERVVLCAADATGQSAANGIRGKVSGTESGGQSRDAHPASGMLGANEFSANTDNLNGRRGTRGKDGAEVNHDSLRTVAHAHGSRLEGHSGDEIVRGEIGGGV